MMTLIPSFVALWVMAVQPLARASARIPVLSTAILANMQKTPDPALETGPRILRELFGVEEKLIPHTSFALEEVRFRNYEVSVAIRYEEKGNTVVDALDETGHLEVFHEAESAPFANAIRQIRPELTKQSVTSYTMHYIAGELRGPLGSRLVVGSLMKLVHINTPGQEEHITLMFRPIADHFGTNLEAAIEEANSNAVPEGYQDGGDGDAKEDPCARLPEPQRTACQACYRQYAACVLQKTETFNALMAGTVLAGIVIALGCAFVSFLCVKAWPICVAMCITVLLWLGYEWIQAALNAYNAGVAACKSRRDDCLRAAGIDPP